MDRQITAGDFNKLNSVAIFMGPVMSMYPAVTKEELRILMDRGESFVLLNVLDEESFKNGHIPGSVNIPVSGIERLAAGLIDEDELVIVYSNGPGCAASAIAADKLSTIGYENILRYQGGVKEWKTAGYPIEGSLHEEKKAA